MTMSSSGYRHHPSLQHHHQKQPNDKLNRRSFFQTTSASVAGGIMAQCETTTTSVTTEAVVAGSVGLWGWQVSPAIPATVESNSNSNSAESVEDDFITTESGLQYKVVKEGTGAIPLPGQTVKAHYRMVEWL
jgi:FKBP-type peptidyl-prolyl cis-trans isomerase